MNRRYRSSAVLDSFELDEFLDQAIDEVMLDQSIDSAIADLLTPSPVSNKPILRRGSRGTAVRELQNLLTQKGFPLQTDGIFGFNTDAAVRSFQRSRGLRVDGIVGPNTWAALLGSGGTPRVTSPCDRNPYPLEFSQAAQTAGVPVSWANDPSLCELVQHESNWNPAAKNPRSSAFGLFQFLTSTWQRFLPEVPYGTINPYWQAVGGFRYIRDTYRTPDRAWAFWRATVGKNYLLASPDLQGKAKYWIAKGWGGY